MLPSEHGVLLMSVKFLSKLPRFIFFTGKGGVGKTSLACASAIHLADQGLKVLLVSTDPASNVGQVLSVKIGNRITPITQALGLDALEIDPEQAAKIYRERIVGPVRCKLPESAVRSIEEQLSGACTTEIAAFDEFTALMTDAEIAARYDHIIFDTAPTGHTIRMLRLPGAWDSFIEANPEGASCLGPLAGLEKQRQQYHAAVQALSDPMKTRLVLVARAQQSSLNEVARTSQDLAQSGLKKQFLAINGLMPTNSENDPLAIAIASRERAALADMPEIFIDIPTDYFELLAINVLGLNTLRSLLSGKQQPLPEEEVEQLEIPHWPLIGDMLDELGSSDHGLIMLMGKGGVGKTTLAEVIAIALAERGHRVHLTTSDPAAHLDTTLEDNIPDLQVSRIDPKVETQRYRQQVLATKGKNLDAQGRALLEEDLRSPCTEEIAVFQAFSRMIREASDHFVVMDTAPTGHTLLLLDATDAYHRDVARHMQGKSARFITPMMRLQDSEQTKILIVTLPETTPVLEASNLQEDLRRAGIEPWGWIVNQSLATANPSSGLLRYRAVQESSQLLAIEQQYAKRFALVPVQEIEPVGLSRLKLISSR